jgi:hypothetical protein
VASALCETHAAAALANGLAGAGIEGMGLRITPLRGNGLPDTASPPDNDQAYHVNALGDGLSADCEENCIDYHWGLDSEYSVVYSRSHFEIQLLPHWGTTDVEHEGWPGVVVPHCDPSSFPHWHPPECVPLATMAAKETTPMAQPKKTPKAKATSKAKATPKPRGTKQKAGHEAMERVRRARNELLAAEAVCAVDGILLATI